MSSGHLGHMKAPEDPHSYLLASPGTMFRVRHGYVLACACFSRDTFTLGCGPAWPAGLSVDMCIIDRGMCP